ncbi:MAG: rod shape-determining protein [Planctomycetes bacterium]|nr:rod shape-determining protein [Planctomycetota bacterium]
MIFETILGWWSRDLGIDLGTANTLVYVRNEGIVLSEPSVVAVDKESRRVVAVGRRAKEMLGRTNFRLEAIRPLQSGVIANFDMAEAMLTHFVHRCHRRRYAVAPRMVIAVPSGITEVEERAVYNSAERAGARKVYLIPEPKAAAIGAGLDITEPTASMVVDIGGGTAEVAVLSLADIVASQSIRTAGDAMDRAIIHHVRDAHQLLIGEPTAERVKIEIGCARPLQQEMVLEVMGRDTVKGRPRVAQVSSEEVRLALAEPIQKIVAAVHTTLQQTEPELSADLVRRGMVLCGGGALLSGLGQLLEEETGLPVHIPEDPLSCVARGTGVFLENLDRFLSPFAVGPIA